MTDLLPGWSASPELTRRTAAHLFTIAAILLAAGQVSAAPRLAAAAIAGIAALALARDLPGRLAAILAIVGVVLLGHLMYLTSGGTGASRDVDDRAAIQAETTVRSWTLERRQSLARRLNAIETAVHGVVQPTRIALFSILGDHTGTAQGAEIRNEHGELMAWWGLSLSENVAVRRWQFDVTSLYIVERRTISVPGGGAWTTVIFERVPNFSRGEPHELIRQLGSFESVRFHTGGLAKSNRARRIVVDSSENGSLYADLIPGSAASTALVNAATRRSASALLLLGAAVVLGMSLRLLGLAGISLEGWRGVALGVSHIALARVALLGFALEPDHWSIFGYSAYGSRLLGAWSRSPFDLWATAVSLFLILLVLSRRLMDRAVWPWIQPFALTAMGWGYTRLSENLAHNSRLSATPDHVIPSSPAQALLMAAMIGFACAVIQLTRIDTRKKSILLSALSTLVLGGIVAAVASSWFRPMFSVAAIVAVSIALCALLPSAGSWSISARAAAVVLLVYIPGQFYMQVMERRFIEETLAPLVAGESTLLRSIIERNLETQFGTIELTTILPASLAETSLEDLGWALWLRSTLPLPAVIRITDNQGKLISRFGVGLPQFTAEHKGQEGKETLQVGAFSRELLHHTFRLTREGQEVAQGSVHVLSPADPGAVAESDGYLDFFTTPSDGESALRYRVEVAVFDPDGNRRGSMNVRVPRAPAVYFRTLRPGTSAWESTKDRLRPLVLVRRTQNAIWVFPMKSPTPGQHARRIGGIAIWTAIGILLFYGLPILPRAIRSMRHGVALDLRMKTSLWVAAVVVIPLLAFVLFVRAYLADRLETETLDHGRDSLSTAQRVIEDYVAASAGTPPEDVLDDETLTWLGRVVGHDLHLYRSSSIFASSRRDLFTAGLESPRLPGAVYADLFLRDLTQVRAEHRFGAGRFVEIYSPLRLEGQSRYILALPLILQAKQIEAQVDDLATSIYLLLVAIAVAAVVVAHRVARTVTTPVHALVRNARAIGRGDFGLHTEVPGDPDLGLLVRTFDDMADSIRIQQEALRLERDRLKTLLESITAAVVVIDEASCVVTANRAARSLFEIEEEPGGARFDPPFREVALFAQRANTGLTCQEEIEILVDTTVRTLRLTIVPLPGSTDTMLIAEDVTEILRSNRLEAWAEMARRIAHEIKNPLTPIQLTADHLRTVAERDDPRLRQTVVSGVANILRQVETLRQTSREFSDYASLREPKREPVDLRLLLDEIASGYRQGNDLGCHVHVETAESTPEWILADRKLLQGAILNLVENALRAVAGGGSVRLESDGINGLARIRVHDSGSGVPAEMLTKIFDPYFSTRAGGTGLGLAIARKTVEDHGGRIFAEKTDQGFCVTMEIPQK